MRAAACGLLLYGGVFWTVKFAFYSPAYLDAQAQVLALLILWVTLLRRRWLIPPLLAIATLQKETALLLLPVVVAPDWVRSGRDVKTVVWLVLVFALPLAVFVAVRVIIIPLSEVSFWDTLKFVLARQLGTPGMWPRLGLALFSGLGLLPALLALFPRQVGLTLKTQPMWLVMILAGALALFLGVDKARLFLFMTPAVVVAAANVCEPSATACRTRDVVWLGSTLFAHFTIGRILWIIPDFQTYLRRMAPMHAQPTVGDYVLPSVAVVVWIALTVALRPERASLDGPNTGQ
jgi:hypothetical protein